MPDPKDAAIGADQRPCPQPVLDLVPADAGIEELTPGHDAVRPRRDPLDDPVHRRTFCCHWR